MIIGCIGQLLVTCLNVSPNSAAVRQPPVINWGHFAGDEERLIGTQPHDSSSVRSGWHQVIGGMLSIALSTMRSITLSIGSSNG
jgi:hypothetical protein